MMRITDGWGRLVCGIGVVIALTGSALGADEPGTAIALGPDTRPHDVWRDSIGNGFVEGARSFDLKLSRGFGINGGGPHVAHDFWFVHGQFGIILDDVWARDHWYGGNLELTGQLFGGIQDHPGEFYFVGLNGGVRYHFATGCRLNPFIAVSAGISATDIGLPDLSTVFQFNEQIGAGLRYYINDHQAITLEYFAQHISNASISLPNNGVNSHFISLGFTWLF